MRYRSLPFLLALTLTAPVLASGSDHRSPPLDPGYVAECGSCHLPYPPRLLGAESWQALLGQLDRHFQADAGIEAAALEPIRGYLLANARRRPTGPAGAPVLRISETDWFRHEHDEISPARWSRVRSRSDCGACHTGADRGRYSEHEIKLP